MKKNRFFILLIISVVIFSCKKNYPAYDMGKTMIYHIEGNDTISWVAIPNSFTPDGDGKNDVFSIYSDCIQPNLVFELSVINSNNELIFITNKTNIFWEGNYKGQYCPNGSYTYELKVADTVGYVFNHLGIIQLIR